MVTTLVAVLSGAGLLGIIGALVAIPVAAASQLLINGLLFTTRQPVDVKQGANT